MSTAPEFTALIAAGRRALAIEAGAVTQLVARIDERFALACRLCFEARGRVVVSGLGKSGHIGNKIAATLASTGTPAFFLHAAEAFHGDLGMVAPGDVVLVLSNSGETVEVVSLLPHLRRLGTPVIAMTGNSTSTLAHEADVVLDISVEQEACTLDLAPTASTTCMLAMGDALAIALLEARGFTAEEFVRRHPLGILPGKALLHVSDLMRRDSAVPSVTLTTPVAQGLAEMGRKGLGLTAVVDAESRLLGVFTDGDLRRALDRGTDLRTTTMAEVMTGKPRSITAGVLATEAVNRMQAHSITALLVVDEQGHLVGAVNIHDLLRAGVV